MQDELAYASVFSLRSNKVPAAALVEVLLERIGALDAPGSPTALQSVLAVSGQARDEARACDEAGPAGPTGPSTASRSS